MTEEGYPIYLRAKPFRASSPCVPAERRLPEKKKKEITHTHTHNKQQQLQLDLADPNLTKIISFFYFLFCFPQYNCNLKTTGYHLILILKFYGGILDAMGKEISIFWKTLKESSLRPLPDPGGGLFMQMV